MTVMKYLNNAAQIRFNEMPGDTGMVRCNWFVGVKVVSADFHQNLLEAVKVRSSRSSKGVAGLVKISKLVARKSRRR